MRLTPALGLVAAASTAAAYSTIARADPSPDPSPAPSSAPSSAPADVVVRGRAREPSATTLRRDDVRAIPGAFGDPFRAVQVLPGALPVDNGNPYPILRGAAPGNTAVLIDGIPV